MIVIHRPFDPFKQKAEHPRVATCMYASSVLVYHVLRGSFGYSIICLLLDRQGICYGFLELVVDDGYSVYKFKPNNGRYLY